MTDEEAATILEAVVVFDDDPAALEPYRRAVVALRIKRRMVDALRGAFEALARPGGPEFGPRGRDCDLPEKMRLALESAKENA